MNDTNVEPLYSEADAARMVGVKIRSLRIEREHGRIAFKRVAGIPLYSKTHLVEWLNSNVERGRESFINTGTVYFLHAINSNTVKVGYTTNLLGRVRAIQLANPETIKLIGSVPGSFHSERAYHQAIWPHHVKGEWFYYNDKVVVFIKNILDRSRQDG